MNLPIFNSNNKDLTLMQNKWASVINPLLTNPLSKASILKNIALKTGNNTINHLQGQPLNGYFVVGMRGAFTQIYDVPSSMPNLTLILNSSADAVIDLAVF